MKKHIFSILFFCLFFSSCDRCHDAPSANFTPEEDIWFKDSPDSLYYEDSRGNIIILEGDGIDGECDESFLHGNSPECGCINRMYIYNNIGDSYIKKLSFRIDKSITYEGLDIMNMVAGYTSTKFTQGTFASGEFFIFRMDRFVEEYENDSLSDNYITSLGTQEINEEVYEDVYESIFQFYPEQLGDIGAYRVLFSPKGFLRFEFVDGEVWEKIPD